MLTYSELYFNGNSRQIADFYSRISTFANGDWHYSILQDNPTTYLVFEYHGKKVDQASLYIVKQDDPKENELRVTNIVPAKKSELSIGEYNAFLNLFYQEVVLQYKKNGGLVSVVGPTSSIFDPLTVISENALEKLISFCHCANHSTGSSHPCDKERWLAFVCQTVDDNRLFDAMSLSTFLQDNDYWNQGGNHYSWAAGQAEQLSLEYEQESEALLFYKKLHEID